MTWRHPVLGAIEPIVRRFQPGKVWKHLYNPAEQWEVVCDADVPALIEQAELAGCPPFRQSKLVPLMDWRTKRLLQQHHDQAYGPAYSGEMATANTRWTVKLADGRRWIARTPRAVIVIVARDEPVSRVRTAYRPLPPLPGVGWREEDFQRQADYVFDKENGMAVQEASRLAAELSRLATGPIEDVRDAWWLALAVGRARGLVGRHPDLVELLVPAERVLGTLTSDVRDALTREVNADDLLDALGEGLKQDEPEDLEAALSNVEDTLVVLSTMGSTAAAGALLDGARELMAWVPAEHGFLATQASHRRAELGESGPASELWEAVEESVSGAQLRKTQPSDVPSSSMFYELLSMPPLLARIASWRRRGAEDIRAWAQEQLAGLAVRQPAPAMGRPAAGEEPWSIRGHRVEGGFGCRAFVVDEENADGWEITSELAAGGADLWYLEEPGQTANVVLIAGPPPLPGDGLAELLDAVEARDDVVVMERRLTRPS